jgi:glycosyltransferase involved in cell wall biosynthesis
LPEKSAAPGGPRILCVATLEGRKNHVALLDAAESLWREGLAFELELIGLARPDTAAPALARLAALRAAGRPLQHHGSVSDSALHAAYARCTFTVYPSLHEGFGLPVLESLQHGKPCLCAPAGALAESARGGGCLMVPVPDALHLTNALRDLLASPAQLAALTLAARQRTFRSWRNYAQDIAAWARELRRRA